MRLRIDLAYDGGPFHGFARQPDVTTVQGTLEGALSRVLGVAVGATCAGRTDAGVHATAQVCHLDVPEHTRGTADLDDLRRRIDALVGDAIAIWSIRRVSDDFDARFSATGRLYRYRLSDAPQLHPLRRHDVWHLGAPALRIGAMREAARHLVGEHDFAAFCRAAEGRTTVRRIDRIAVSRRPDGLVRIELRAPAFCHQQVRSITGALVEVGRGTRDADWVRTVLGSGDRSRAAPVAPPHGLVLERVSYGRRWPASPLR